MHPHSELDCDGDCDQEHNIVPEAHLPWADLATERHRAQKWTTIASATVLFLIALIAILCVYIIWFSVPR
jgi:hypothetical protein